MKIVILTIGKTNASFLKEGVGIYLERLKHYAKVEYKELPDAGSRGILPEVLKEKEGEVILKQIKQEDFLLLLDEKGEHYSSRQFADFLQKKMNAGTKNVFLVIGGAFGFSQEVYDRANGKISFSRMTFSHEMIRLLLAEQLYRAFTILKGEGYHHD